MEHRGTLFTMCGVRANIITLDLWLVELCGRLKTIGVAGMSLPLSAKFSPSIVIGSLEFFGARTHFLLLVLRTIRVISYGRAHSRSRLARSGMSFTFRDLTSVT